MPWDNQVAYVKAPFIYDLRSVPMPDPVGDEVVVRIMACGVCATDVGTAAVRAVRERPFGHEMAGTVVAVGGQAAEFSPGEPVCLTSSYYCSRCDNCHAGRVDLCGNVNSLSQRAKAAGFSRYVLARAHALVRTGSLTAVAAALAEPLGVAQDLVVSSGLTWGDSCLVVGVGAIGLMAVALARNAGASPVVAMDIGTTSTRKRVAERWGIDGYADARTSTPGELKDRFGWFNRVLVTAPPAAIAATVEAAAIGGIITYIGIDKHPGATITLDADAFHFRKLQLRSSHASPALWLPRSVDLLRRGVVRWRDLVTHQFPLHELPAAIRAADDREGAIKVIVRPGEP